MMNILNGGAHADTGVDVQEFMVAPIGAPSFKESLRWGAEVYHSLKSVLKEKGLSTGLGDEGGFAPDVAGTKEALDLITIAVNKTGLKLGTDVALALDVAATEFYTDGTGYKFEGKNRTAAEMAAFYAELIDATRSFPSRIRSTKTTGTAGSHSPIRSATRSSSSATTSSSPTPSASKKASSRVRQTHSW